jgi:hypothetical protein
VVPFADTDGFGGEPLGFTSGLGERVAFAGSGPAWWLQNHGAELHVGLLVAALGGAIVRHGQFVPAVDGHQLKVSPLRSVSPLKNGRAREGRAEKDASRARQRAR